MKIKSAFTAVVVMAALALSACSSTVLASNSSAPIAAMTNPVTGGVADMEQTLERIYAQVNPSVVAIQVTESSSAAIAVFGDLPQLGLGSGFVWDKDGHIVTNNHVVAGAGSISVEFYDGTIVPAAVIGADPDSDLAVLKINLPADQLQPVTLGDSTQVKVGQLSVAIGNPFGNQNTLTVGFVGALARALPIGNQDAQGVAYTIPDVIQTDTAINPGNSGGVLADDQGHVIGVTAGFDSPVRASSGVGFAIPAAIVQKVVPELIAQGYYDHTWLGISGTALIPDLASAMNLKSDQRGALINNVTPGSPAERAGLQSSHGQIIINGLAMSIGGDVITAIDHQPVKTFDDLIANLTRSSSVGQIITLTILRNGKSMDVNVTLAARPAAMP